MAQQFVTDAGVLIIPSAAVSIKVQQGASGLATTGVLMLVGEADAGPDYSLEEDLTENSFGPDELGDILAKYKSGPLVDAFLIAATPANDPDILGSPNRFIMVKTNPSTKASHALLLTAGGAYASLYDKSYGNLGNLIYYTIDETVAEVKPTTSSFTFIPPVGTADITFRTNGAAAVTYTATAAITPTAFVSAVEALSGVSATGGANRLIIQAARVADASTLAVAVVSGNTITLTISTTWSVTPTVGDTLVIPDGSAVEGAANANVGAYVITAATSSVITATKLSDFDKPAAVPGVITAPAAVGAADIASISADAVAYTPVTITTEGIVFVEGTGKTLEINQLTTGTDLFERTAFGLGTITPVTWLSKTGAATQLVSAAERRVTLNVNRQFDNVQEELTAGGQIALKIGCTSTTCVVVVSSTGITLTPTGGSASTLTLAFKNYPTLSDLATYINAQTGYSAAVGTTSLGQFSPFGLDEGTFAAGTTFGNQTLRLKVDAVKFFTVVSENSVLVQLSSTGLVPATAGLPATVATATYLAGGAKGGTTNTIFNAAMTALEMVKGNFVVPLFSRDATDDIADDLTDSSSTYTIANVHAVVRTHVLKMSTLKRRKNRQGFLSIQDSFDDDKDAALNLASARISLNFQDTSAVGGNGLDQFQPWAGSALAAGMQAAGFYRAIFNKGINCSGFKQAAGDFNPADDTKVEDALLAGLLVGRKADSGGGFVWVSDQTTYSKDNNFVFNSIQAMYAIDTMALTCAERMQRAFVGQSIADINAALALSALEGIMADFLRLKLIAPSDDAPKGFKNPSIKISGTTMAVSVEVKLAGAVYFVPINFLVSQVTQAAA